MRKAIVWSVAVLMLVGSAAAQQFWDKKSYDKWSRDECKKMLNDSPWVQRYGMSVPVFAAQGGRTGSDVTSLGGASTLDITYTAQLRSALPMRQAVVQQTILDAARQLKDAEKLQALRVRAEKFVTAPTNDIVIVHVIYASNDVNIDKALAHYWQQQSIATLKDIFTLVAADGRRAQPIRYEALPGAGREFAVTFPRIVDGKPMLTPQDATLAVEFFNPAVDISGTSVTSPSRSSAIAGVSRQSQVTQKDRIVLQYKAKDMLRGGELVY